MTAPVPTVADVEALVDAHIEADEYLRPRAARSFDGVSATWRGGHSIRHWRALDPDARHAVVRGIVRSLLGTRPASGSPDDGALGWLAPCACLCGEFVAARGPRPVRLFKRGHALKPGRRKPNVGRS